MTMNEAIRHAERVTFGFPFRAWGLRLDVRPGASGELHMRLRFDRTPHRDTGAPGPLAFATAVQPEMFGTPEALHRYVHALARDFASHEVSESLLVDGVRIFDPHEAER